MTDQITQPSKIHPKWKAIASLVLGIISVIPGIILYFQPGIIMGLVALMGANPMASNPIMESIFWLILPLIALIGFILGIMGLKSIKRNFAITGIVLCIIGLVVPILYFVFY